MPFTFLIPNRKNRDKIAAARAEQAAQVAVRQDEARARRKKVAAKKKTAETSEATA